MKDLPLGTKIWLFFKNIVDLERDEYGVYELLDRSDEIIYIGYGRIKSSLIQHFPDGNQPISGAWSFGSEYTFNEEKAKKRQSEELEKYLKKHGRYPASNR